ncbi:MAG: MATE family efflux transporter [Deltaproteobacteria bacterium]|nr:MAG: MATE family efflux transporter [Deltaproteobacteria bacterium]
MAATTLMEFTDRMFLANYAVDAIAAAVPAGIAVFLMLTLFMGVTTYLNVFIAQYLGAGQPDRVGACLWQGIYFSMAGAIALIGVSLCAGPLFEQVGHAPEVQVLEVAYFSILCRWGGIYVLGTALACFFSGQGRTRPILAVNMVGMLFNIPLDYALINGTWGFPERGIQGAGIATVCSWTLMTLIFTGLVFTGENERRFGVVSARSLDRELLMRIIRKGGPAALQFSMDVLAFTLFVFLIGRLGKTALAVSNIALSIESIAFMPAIGFSMGLSTLVGHALGKNDVAGAIGCTHQTVKLLMSYTLLLDGLLIFFPEALLTLFIPSGSDAAIREQGIGVLRIVAVYISFDAMYFTFIGVLKGAGDTRFIMWSIGLISLTVMVLPLILIIGFTDWGLYACWINLTVYVLALFTVTLIRYRQGKWRDIRVI